jgi:hypothetical protein
MRKGCHLQDNDASGMKTDMIEGAEALQRFQAAVRKVLSVPKGSVPNPFGKRTPKRKKEAKPKG